jgi:hypothetical protein
MQGERKIGVGALMTGALERRTMHLMRTTADPQAAELTLLVSVDSSTGALRGEVLGPPGVTPFQGRTELVAALDEATVTLSRPA